MWTGPRRPFVEQKTTGTSAAVILGDTSPILTQLFSDPGKKREPFLGKTIFSGATKNRGKRVPLNN